MKTLTTIFKLYLILNLLLAKVDSLTCGEEEIKNCKFCLGGDGTDQCDECEDGYFPLLGNLTCIACDDPIYGQPGCKGNCKYQNGNIQCLGECKEGFYKSGYSCNKCEGCKNCTGNNICHECINKDYKLQSNRCYKCSDILTNCKKCHFVENENEPKEECEECQPDYYLNSNKKCNQCSSSFGVNGLNCKACSTNKTKTEFCWCYSGLVYKNGVCESCPDGCSQCIYDSKKNSSKCLTCDNTHTLHSNGSCVYCGDGCQNCYLDQNNNAVCLSCGYNQYLSDENKCINCPGGCSKCYYDKKEKRPICTECPDANYEVIAQNKSSCISCEDMIEGCSRCQFNSTSKQYECSNCNTNNYILVQNTHKCLPISEYSKLGLSNCYIEYNEKSKTYECSSCSTNNYIPVKNDNQSCLQISMFGSLSDCLEAEKKGDTYSCIKCPKNYLLKTIDKKLGIKDCFYRRIDYCLEANEENEETTCTKCIENSSFNNEKICQCNPGFVGKNSDKNFCYKCDDRNLNNPGCDATQECHYNEQKDLVNCTKCKDGYFETKDGQCKKCSEQIINCGKCHKDKQNNTLICDSCIDSMYIWNYKKGECELNECEEHRDISPGCIICKDKLDEYEGNHKCQRCKYGYFKTKDEKCVYCSSEKYGGPACNYCGYEIDKDGKETDNIICKGCFSISLSFYSNSITINNENNYLSSEGKCYNCKIKFSDACTKCGFVKSGDNKEILKCLACTDGYYLNAEGNCISFINLIKRIDHCYKHEIELGQLNCDFSNNNKKESFSCSTNNNYYNNNITFFYPNGITEQIDSKCTSCESGYFVNKNGICEQLNYEKCSFFSLIKNYNDDKLTDGCNAFCNLNNNVLIKLKIKENEGSEKYKEITLNDIKNDNYIRNLFLSKLGEANIDTLCKNNTDENGDLAHCKNASYFPNNNSYICIDCLENYYLDTETNLCQDSCKIVNVKNEEPPSYICQSGGNGGKKYTLVTYENEAQDYILAEGDLLNCVEARADTTYAKTIYNCTKCVSNNFVPYFNKFYNRTKCVYLNEDITKEIDKYEINYMFYSDKNRVDAKDGICEKHDFFTPDEKFCHKCDSEIFGKFGNPGCKGECDYSTKREHPIRCKGGCKSGYVESSEGYCSKCDSINKGCIDCSYEKDNSDPKSKRKGRFDCKFCDEGYMKSSSGECVSCSSLGLPNCVKCLESGENNVNYVCKQCNTSYFINEEGRCQMLYPNQFKNSENKIISCDDISEGGIDNCLYCENNGEKTICNTCSPGYILETESNSCLEIANNKELQNFFSCEELIKEDVKYSCSRCKEGYALVSNDGNKCLYIPTLYDSDFKTHYNIYYNALHQGNLDETPFDNFIQNDYIYKRYSQYAPCQEAINDGTDDNPLYSCVECYEEKIPDYEAGSNNRGITKIKGIKLLDIHTQVNFCINPKNLPELEHCTEATYEIKKGEEFYNCTTCEENYFSTINKETNMSYCKEQKDKSICQVYFCQKCDENNGNICEQCSSDYEVSSITGACIKKLVEVPIIIWKDIYNLKLESVKNINNI